MMHFYVSLQLYQRPPISLFLIKLVNHQYYVAKNRTIHSCISLTSFTYSYSVYGIDGLLGIEGGTEL